jgi:hypothetical protein
VVCHYAVHILFTALQRYAYMALIFLFWQIQFYHCTINCIYRAVRYNVKLFIVKKYSSHWEIFRIKIIYSNCCCLIAFPFENIHRPSLCSRCLYNILRGTQLYNIVRGTQLYNIVRGTQLYNIVQVTQLYDIVRVTQLYNIVRGTQLILLSLTEL